jgi:predicted nucleic acid-binding protein
MEKGGAQVSSSKKLVLDANILLRAVFGKRVRFLLKTFEDSVELYTPDICVVEAKKYIPSIAAQREIDPRMAEGVLAGILSDYVQLVDCGLYEMFEERARARISSRDVDDWPVVATALLLDAPIWTEDRDFFGTGIATWTSNRIELYLRDA